jgi:hypothetical protein
VIIGTNLGQKEPCKSGRQVAPFCPRQQDNR